MSIKSGTGNQKLFDSINYRSKDNTTAGGSCLFKTMETVKMSDNTTDAYKKGMNHLMILTQDKQGLSSLQQYKNHHSLRGSFKVPHPTTLMEDLAGTNINFKIPDQENPAG